MSKYAQLPSEFDEASLPADPIHPKLLISVKSSIEAALALRCGVDWIDLKNPEMGALGRPSIETAEEVAQTLAAFANCSAALGELRDLDLAVAFRLSRLFPIVKVGLSGQAARPELTDDFLALGNLLATSKLVPVLYADCHSCNAPPADAIIRLAEESSAPFVLVDTFRKDGRSLVDWMSLAQIADVISAVSAVGSQAVLAGSLQLSHVPQLVELQPAALAFRGAACLGKRTNTLCADRIRSLARLVKGSPSSQAPESETNPLELKETT